MALLLVVAATEATDPTRVSDPFRTTANVGKVLSLRPPGEARVVAEEVRAGQVVVPVSSTDLDRQTMEPVGSASLREGGKT